MKEQKSYGGKKRNVIEMKRANVKHLDFQTRKKKRRKKTEKIGKERRIKSVEFNLKEKEEN